MVEEITEVVGDVNEGLLEYRKTQNKDVVPLNASVTSSLMNSFAFEDGFVDHYGQAKEQEEKEIMERALSRTKSMTSDQSDDQEIKQRIIRAQSVGSDVCKISFRDIHFQVTVQASSQEIAAGAPPAKQLDILKGCTGFCLPGELTFIMGASGAGKTSLLNIMSDRIGLKPGMTISGNVTFNDVTPITTESFSNSGSYVMQDDIIFAYFTVKEALRFAARLKLNISEEEQEKKISQLIEDLGLSHCQDTMVGSQLKKLISGGERKRTAIGVELITDPKVILLDEPTSGLDSFTAVKIVKVLQNLARRRNKTIVSTIHQPSSEAFSHCDRLILMCDGHIVYQGKGSDSGTYFKMKERGLVNRNPCDFFMRELSVNYPKKQADEDMIKKYQELYALEQEPKVMQDLQDIRFQEVNLQLAMNRGVAFGTQLKLLRARALVFVKREPQVIKAKIGQAIFIGLLMLSLYLGVGDFEADADNPQKIAQDIQNQAGCTFFVLVSLLMNWLFGSILTFQLERDVFLREQANKLYHPSAYFFAKNMVETPVAIISPLFTLLIIYWGVPYIHFGRFYLVMVIVAQTAMGMGLLISSMASNVNTATAIAPLFTMPMILFGGFIANTDTLPSWLGWVQWLSPIRYGNEALSHSQYDEYELPNCNEVSLSLKEADPRGAFMCLEGFTIGYWECIAANIGLMIFWRVLSLIVLKCQIGKVQ